MLAYGVVADLFDEYMRMSESTCLEPLRQYIGFAKQWFRCLQVNITSIPRLKAYIF
jgi:hypothetical protein